MEWWIILIIVLCAAFAVLAAIILIYAYRFTLSYFTRHEFTKVTSAKKRKKLMSSKKDYHDFVKKSATALSELKGIETEITSQDGIKLRGV